TTAIKGISLGYSSLDMKVGDVKLITATPIPSNADNWDGAQWYVNGTGAELYIDEACKTPYYRSIHGYKTELYLKATEKNNDITVGVEKTIGYNSIVRGTMTVNVTDEDGNYKLRQMVLPEVNLHAGESVTVDISTYPNPSLIEGVPSIVPINMPEDVVITINSTAKTAKITANSGTPVGNYSCAVYIDGQPTSLGSFISVNVINDEIPVESISVSPENVTLAPGMSYKFNLTVNPTNACVSDTVKWEYYSGSSNITVDSTGIVKVADDAKGGTSTVFRVSYGGKSTTFKVTVATPVETVRVNLTKPEAGELPSAPTLVTTDGVDTDSLTYKWYDTWGTYTEMNPTTDRFEPGKTYRICMEVDAADGCLFTNSVVAQLGIAGGVDTCVVNNNTVNRLYFYEDFTIPGVEDPEICLLGDVNLDGVVTIDDATLVQKYLAGISELDDPIQLLAADVDSSGEITIDDATRIQKYLAGLIDEF
ncbi:MAG: dockerin type I domain-containing protein, partial [Eubacterium sp.]